MLDSVPSQQKSEHAATKNRGVIGMDFMNAKRTDVIRGSDNREIGWVYTTETGERVTHYFTGMPPIAVDTRAKAHLPAQQETSAA